MTNARSPTHNLEEVQRWMQTTIMHPVSVEAGIASAEARQHIDVAPAEAEKVISRSAAQTALERLAIYSHAYYARLLECLQGEFPVLMHALGQELFDAFAVGYLQAYPSRSYTLVQLGANFPRYLAETRPQVQEGDGLPPDWPDFLIDLATLELNFNEVFDGPGVEGQLLLDPKQLAALPPERLAAGRLVGVSCLRLLVLKYPIHKYYVAARRKRDPDPPAPGETWLAITRRDYIVRHYELSRPAYELLHSLLAGKSVGQAISRAAESAGPDLDRLEKNLQSWFRDWAAEGFFQGLEFPD